MNDILNKTNIRYGETLSQPGKLTQAAKFTKREMRKYQHSTLNVQIILIAIYPIFTYQASGVTT